MTEPAGSLSLSQSYLRAMLSECAAFQTWVSAANATEALASIYYEGLPDPADKNVGYTRDELESVRPYAVIFLDEEEGFLKSHIATGSSYDFEDHGRLKLRLEQDAPDDVGDEPNSDANLRWKNVIGQIIDDLCGLAGTAGNLAFTEIGVDFGPYWGDPKRVPSDGVWQGVDIGVVY